MHILITLKREKKTFYNSFSSKTAPIQNNIEHNLFAQSAAMYIYAGIIHASFPSWTTLL